MPEESGRSHLDDEGLNAVLDGEAQADAAAHAHACADCSARLDRFRQVARVVATPVMPVDAERRGAAVAAALGSVPEAGADNIAAAAVPPAVGEGPSPAVPPLTILARYRTRRPGRLVGWSVAAAAVAALALGIPRLDDGLGGSGGGNLATGSAEDTSAGVAESGSEACRNCAGTGPWFTDGGELGDLDRSALDGLAVRLGADSEPGALSGQADASDANEAARTDDAAPPAAPAPSGVEAPGEVPALGVSDLEVLVARCEGVARERDPGLGALDYVARARIDDVAVVVLGFASGPDSPGAGATTVVALAVTDCREVASATA